MTLAATWIRNNMLSCDQYERQLTEAELRVQRSLQKLSIPDWYLNKRSSPPKILNVTRIESRVPSWKLPIGQKNSSLNSTSSNLSDTLPLEANKPMSKTNKNEPEASKPKSPEARQKKSASKIPAVEEKKLDTTVPQVKLPKYISKTFPKRSPSRKIQNINLVFPSQPTVDHSDDFEDKPVTQESKYNTFVLKKQPTDIYSKKENRPNKNPGSPRKSPKKRRIKGTLTLDVETTPVKSPDAKAAFNVPAASTPKFTPVNLFSSTTIEETPKRRKVPAQSILEKSSIFEDSSISMNSSSSYVKSSCVPRRQLTRSLLERTSIFENSLKMDQTCCIEDMPRKVSKLSCSLERNIRSIDPILFQKVETDWPSPTSTLKVRDIVKRLEVTGSTDNTLEGKRISVPMKIPSATGEKTTNQNRKQPVFVQEKHTNISSPCTKFLTSRRKSTDLENVIKSKEPSRGKGVKVLIETLTKKLGKSPFPRPNQTSLEVSQENFVMKVVNSLEKGVVPTAKNVDSPTCSTHEDSSSETEVKSCTSSPKDTDSSSDSDLRSPGFKCDEDRTFNYERKSKTLPLKKRAHNEDDSVYWIPVSRCKLPRTSSLMSMMSKLSTNSPSPCVSPIRSESETENADWGATFKKNNCLSRKLFRIDETTVLDSGYSDRSDRSGVSNRLSLTDSAWSEDTQIDSGSETKSAKVKRSLRRKSIVGQT